MLYKIHKQNSWGKTLVYITNGSMCVIVVLRQKASEKSISQMPNICHYTIFTTVYLNSFVCVP